MTFKYVSQIDERDCGVAALSMILNKYGQTNSLASLRALAKTDLEGTTALGIVRAAEKLNFETKAIRADTSLMEVKDLPLPFIVHVNKDGKYPHYYVIYGVHRNYLKIADPDPLIGKIRMNYERFSKEWSGVAIFMAPMPNFKPVKDKESSFFSYVPLILRQRKIIANIILAALLITTVGIGSSFYLQGVLDTYIPNGMKSTLDIVSVGLIVAYIIQQVLNYAKSYLLLVLGQRLSIDVILSYIKHLFVLPMNFFETRRVGEITSRFSDANTIIDAISNIILSIFLDFGILLMVGVTLLIQNSKLFLLSLAEIPIYLVVLWIFSNPFTQLSKEQMQAGSILNSTIIESLNGVETIKSLAGERVTYSKVDREFVDVLKKSFKFQKAVQLQDSIKNFFRLMFNVLILWYGSSLVIKNIISVGQLMAFNALLAYFTDPLQNILNLQSKLQAARVANHRLNEVYLVPSEFGINSEDSMSVPINNDIEVKNLNFSYNYGILKLKNVNLHVKFGEKIALVGASGSGKSTLAKLLVNFFDVADKDSKILLGNIDIHKMDKTLLRKKITYLPQEPYTFTGNILDNLSLGAANDITNKDILWATEIADIRKDIEELPNGFETEISENTGFSGGQRQRLSIARALLTGSDILILDESTSNLDVLTEKKVIDNLLSIKDKTIIFVAHRLNIARKSARVLVMRDGEIVEEGTHEKLLLSDGYYTQLFNG
ncbi:peptide cleavage/export ABC transporter [Weissella muntiaci]|uniref:Peptide cleavage/export ABC transporter n=1 Tax=Weissella muntiaci TaxID=2508881 RepID=A0A6C2C6N6_9LACO|nr:peptide cleavage/export ABC transporter [Weissella muntiaci]TYC49590.1 peptide cleavage/export ABC transporter [Weissella muntiaci]